MRSLLFCASIVSIASCGAKSSHSQLKEHWNSANDPLTMLPASYSRVLQQLPVSAELAVTPWSDTYWPDREGGIAHRWHGTDENAHSYHPHSLIEASQLDQKEMSKLSPAEKFALFTNDPNYALWSNEVARTSADSPGWFGICHGWSPASLLFKEPKAVTVIAANGVMIPFASSDIKALLSLYTGDYSAQPNVRFLAQRCDIDLNEHPEARNNPECRDVNAGAFHLVITNELALNKRGFVADITRDVQVWNQPVHGFTSVVTGVTQGASPGAAPGTVQEATIQTTLNYGVETSPRWASHGTSTSSIELNYRVELDAAGQIIGGEWLDESRPDFLWAMDRPAFINGPSHRSGGQVVAWSALDWLYQTSAGLAADVADPLQGN